MPRAFDMCCLNLQEGGMAPEDAKRACGVAFWGTYGKGPRAADAEGFDPPDDLAPLARNVALSEDEPDRPQAWGPRSLLVAPNRPELITLAGLISPPADTDKSLWREVEIITPGEYNGFPFTEEIILEFVAAFDPSDPVPLYTDHYESEDNKHGFLRAVRWDDSTKWMRGLVEVLGKYACERVLDGRWKKLSGGFWTSVPRSMFELSFVGRPAVTGARIGRNGEKHMSKPVTPPAAATPETAAATAAPETATLSAQATAATTPAATTEVVQAPAQLAASPAESPEIAQLNARIAQLEAGREADRKRLRTESDLRDFVALMESGHSTAAMREAEIAFLSSLTEEQKPKYLELRKQLPQAWKPGRGSTATLQRPGEKASPVGAAPAAMTDQQVVLANPHACLAVATRPEVDQEYLSRLKGHLPQIQASLATAGAQAKS